MNDYNEHKFNKNIQELSIIKVFCISLTFMALTFLKITGKVFYRVSVNLSLSNNFSWLDLGYAFRISIWLFKKSFPIIHWDSSYFFLQVLYQIYYTCFKIIFS